MSKKKAFSGSTMTLKDFHGGSIPSDLPLPSAPGTNARPADRAGFDRSLSWGNPIGRSDHRLMRPGSSLAAKNFDNKTPFLAHTTRIGRNFDEDERKPLDGSSLPRRTVSDEDIYAPANRPELKPDSCPVKSFEATNMGVNTGLHVPNPYLPTASVVSYAGRASETTQVGAISQKFGGNTIPVVSGPQTNVWAARKVAVSSTESLPLSSTEPIALSKLAHASALEKVSSGRWQTRHQSHHQTDVEIIHHSEMECGPRFKSLGNGGMERVTEREYLDFTLARHVDEVLMTEDGIHTVCPGYDIGISPVHFETRDRNPSPGYNGVLLPGSDVKVGGSVLEPPLISEATDRPKLKLLPRSKPFDSSEPPPIVDCKQHTESEHVETVTKSYPNVITSRQGLADIENRDLLPERPKLNLKPRSQPIEQRKETVVKGRNALFGGARPRELVLKERGIDDVAGDHVSDQGALNREAIPGRAVAPRDIERVDAQRGKWRNEKQQGEQGRDDLADTWHRRAMGASPDPSEGHGKVASAVELAQTFSKSISEARAGPRMPFSRLVGRQINGY